MSSKKYSAGVRKFVRYGEFVDPEFYLTLPKDMKLDFEIMINPCADDPSGVIMFFNVNGSLKKGD